MKLKCFSIINEIEYTYGPLSLIRQPIAFQRFRVESLENSTAARRLGLSGQRKMQLAMSLTSLVTI